MIKNLIVFLLLLMGVAFVIQKCSTSELDSAGCGLPQGAGNNAVELSEISRLFSDVASTYSYATSRPRDSRELINESEKAMEKFESFISRISGYSGKMIQGCVPRATEIDNLLSFYLIGDPLIGNSVLATRFQKPSQMEPVFRDDVIGLKARLEAVSCFTRVGDIRRQYHDFRSVMSPADLVRAGSASGRLHCDIRLSNVQVNVSRRSR